MGLMDSLSFNDSSEIKHAYIICASNYEKCLNMALTIAKAAVCKAERFLPCGRCAACHKADNFSHPDIRIIRKGEAKAKNEISVDQVRDVVLDAAVLPNESERKVYIFADGDFLGAPAQNAALKLLEEPPEGVILILCASRPESFLQTVRSRCVEIIYNSDYENADADTAAIKDLAAEYLRLVEAADPLELFRFCEDNNDLSGQKMSIFISDVAEILANKLCSGWKSGSLSDERLIELERLMEKCAGYLKVNVGVKQIFGVLEVNSIPRTKRSKAAD